MLNISISTFVLILSFTVLLSFFIGYKIRKWLNLKSEVETKLSQELDCTKTEYNNYKQEVYTHFEKTASLFNNMLQQSRELYNHLVLSSEQLTIDNTNDDDNSSNNSSENKTNNKKLEYNKNISDTWPKLNVKNTRLSTANNWHPTYFEAKDAKDAKENIQNKTKEKLDQKENNLQNNKPDLKSERKSESKPELRIVESDNLEDLEDLRDTNHSKQEVN